MKLDRKFYIPAGYEPVRKDGRRRAVVYRRKGEPRCAVLGRLPRQS